MVPRPLNLEMKMKVYGIADSCNFEAPYVGDCIQLESPFGGFNLVLSGLSGAAAYAAAYDRLPYLTGDALVIAYRVGSDHGILVGVVQPDWQYFTGSPA
jgi:hypothetical protein